MATALGALEIFNLFFCGLANIHNLHFKVENFARQGVVHINICIELAHLDNSAGLDAIISGYMNVLADTKFALVLEVFGGNALDIVDVAQAVAICRHYSKFPPLAHGCPFNFCFKTTNHLLMAMKISHGLATAVIPAGIPSVTFIKNLPVVVFKLVVKGDNVVVTDLHGCSR